MLHLGFQGVRVSVPTVETVATGTAVTASGAGTSNANGAFAWSGMDYYYENASSFFIAWNVDKWELTEVGTFYENLNGDADNFPLTGWTVGAEGSAPAPTFTET